MQKIDPRRFSPTASYVLVEMAFDDVEETSKGGIALPKSEVDKTKGAVQMGTVLRRGPEAFINYTEEMNPPKVGDLVLTHRHPGVPIDYDANLSQNEANRFRIVGEPDILAVYR